MKLRHPSRTLLQEIKDLEGLEDGWYDTDGEAGAPPSAEAIRGVRRLARALQFSGLPYPHVSPSVDGGVSAEWTLGDIEASIEFGDSSEYATVSSLNTATGEYLYRESVRVDRAFLKEWLANPTSTAMRGEP